MQACKYRTLDADAQSVYREKGSKFLAYAYVVTDEAECKDRLDKLRKKYFDATHHCYAWRLGFDGKIFRINDDGEPSGTAGKPIYGQILSADITNVLIVVVRYFGGTKLGVPGLISAYKESAREVIGQARIVEKQVRGIYELKFSYLVMNDVMKIVKEHNIRMLSQVFDNLCTMLVHIDREQEEVTLGKFGKIEMQEVELKGYV